MAEDKKTQRDLDAELVTMLEETQAEVAQAEHDLDLRVDLHRERMETFEKQRAKEIEKYRAEREALIAKLDALRKRRGKLCRVTGITLEQVTEGIEGAQC